MACEHGDRQEFVAGVIAEILESMSPEPAMLCVWSGKPNEIPSCLFGINGDLPIMALADMMDNLSRQAVRAINESDNPQRVQRMFLARMKVVQSQVCKVVPVLGVDDDESEY